MSGEAVAAQYQVRLAVPRIGGLRAWGLAEAGFEHRLAIQDRARIADARIEGKTRRGRDYLRVTIGMTVTAPVRRPILSLGCTSGPPRFLGLQWIAHTAVAWAISGLW